MTSNAGKNNSWGEIVEEDDGGDEIVEEEAELFEIAGVVAPAPSSSRGGGRMPMASIKEEYESSLFSYDIRTNEDEQDAVYVVIGGGNSSDEQTAVSMDALAWTLDHLVTINPPPSTTTATSYSSTATIVYLVHVCPELRFIPTPLGKLPISQANPEQREIYCMQERGKRREYLQKFLNKCSASKVNVDTVLIESDMEAKAILDLIPILNIRKLVLGTNKSGLRKLKSKRGNGTVDQIRQGAPEFCEVKIICEGKEVTQEQLMTESPSPSPSPSPRASIDAQRPMNGLQDQINDSFACGCFKPKVVS